MGRPPRISRQQLLDVARRVFSTRGFEAATLAEIGAELGVTPGAILRHVESKSALFAEAMTSGEQIDPPAAILELANIDAASTDPREVLRRVASEVVPFIQRILASRIVVAMRENAMRTSVELPFDPAAQDTPPRRAFMLLAGYFARANEAGTMRVKDPRATALLFMGSLQGYVLFHHVLKVRPVYPLDDYIDALIELWSEGAIRVANSGGTREKDRAAARRPRAAGGGSVRVRAQAEHAEAAGSRRNARGADGERRVARRRPRDPRTRR